MSTRDRIIFWLMVAACSLVSAWALLACAWQELVAYRIRDGQAFEANIRAGTFGHELAGHRCMSSVYEACFYHLPGEPRDYDDECVPPVTSRCRCDHLAAAFCYTVLPVDCASWSHEGRVQYETCDKVFPHGWKHVKELAIP